MSNGSELAFLLLQVTFRYFTILFRLTSSRIRLRLGSGSWGVSRKENYFTILFRLTSSRNRLRLGSGSWGVSRKENKGLGPSTLSLSSAFSSLFYSLLYSLL